MPSDLNASVLADPVLRRFGAALRETYGDRLERAVLFGSRPRGDHQPDSDYDVAVFICGPDRWLTEVKRLASHVQRAVQRVPTRPLVSIPNQVLREDGTAAYRNLA